MVIYRKLLLSFIFVAVFYISTQSTNVIAEVISDEAVQSLPSSIVLDQSPKVRAKHKTRKKNVIITPPIEIEPDLLYKPLDLSIPLNNQKDIDSSTDNKNNGQYQSSDYFETKAKTKPRSLELKGSFITSPEPEIEKKKTVDGAGFSINVKPD